MFTIFRRKIPENIFRFILNQNLKKNYTISSFPPNISSLIPINVQYNLQTVRYKSKKSQKQPPKPTVSDTETEKENTFEDQVVDKNTKIMQIHVKSLRIDGVLKSGLGIARNKIETLFYESKIRVNGQKLLKKSESAQEGDEIDIIKGPSPTNPDFLNVARIEILGITESNPEDITLKIRRCKNLTVENYDDK
ncbi:mitochondrial transcription rescue factor 1 [Tribolium madens]|uniref:mitochondrial transcription rescue factor 1 n=1 Tax=Tribolium madens TaxID=41895 RepID=UPI001CF75976|nr:mitochondrial transcription rescue factor 1 [Tribolium madens]